jgi:hypothetical protein
VSDPARILRQSANFALAVPHLQGIGAEIILTGNMIAGNGEESVRPDLLCVKASDMRIPDGRPTRRWLPTGLTNTSDAFASVGMAGGSLTSR